MADRLRQGFTERHIEVFDFPPGVNLVLDISRALTQSDYFVLLWSWAARERPWVSAEWSAAFALELQQQRSFLFVVRLDAAPLPPLLAPRHYLDVVGDGDAMVNELVATWDRDRSVGEPVLPAPHPGIIRGQTIVLYVRNRDLSVAHVVVVPAESTGRSLDGLVRAELALPESHTMLAGKLVARFSYQLLNAGELIPVDETPLAELCVTDGNTIDLVVKMESFGPKNPAPAVVYRTDAPTGISLADRSLRAAAFGHLIPW